MTKIPSPILAYDEVIEYAKAIAIVAYRFVPDDYGKFYNAHEIADNLGGLPNGQLSTFHVAVDTLKKALSEERLRQALTTILPGKFEFLRSSTRFDIVTTGRFAFPKGYQSKFVVPLDSLSNFRRDISALRAALMVQYFREEHEMESVLVDKTDVISQSPDFVTPLISDGSLQIVPSAEEVNRKKRGRPELTMEDKDLRISRLRNRVNYSNMSSKKSRLSFDEEVNDARSIGSKIVELVNKVGAYNENINGEECLSIVSGLLIQDLISNCGCSVEKLPMIIGTVLTMLFGEIDEDTYSILVKAHSTYALASERTSLVAVLEVKKRFADRDAENRVLYSWLILDASNKKGKGCVGKIVMFVGFDGIVRQLALRLDTTVTKKALGSSRITIESLETEVADGIVWIMGITTDAFGAAVEEAALILKHIDERASQIYLKSPDLLHRRSAIIPGLIYKYGGRFRELCVRTCQMHNFERILANMISTLMGNQGLGYDMTTAQNLYRLNYYWIKYRAMVNALTVESVGGNPELFNNAPEEIRNVIGSVNATRLLSTERVSDHMFQTLSVPASDSLTKFICDYFGGPDSENWLLAKQYCTCINSEELSHTMLSFWYLANHTPGGKKGEGAVGCLSVLGFLGSPYQRITIMIVASLYPIHLAWAKFSDKPAEIGIKPKCASTRSIEGVRFDRLFLESMLQLSSNWGEFLPDALTFLQREAERAEVLELVRNKEEVINFFDSLMKKGTSTIMSLALKYFFYPGLRPAWSILQVVDPYVGSAAATAILSALKSLKIIDVDTHENPVEVPHYSNDTRMVIDERNIDGEDEHTDSSTDDDEGSNASETDGEQALNDMIPQVGEASDTCWSTGSKTHAARTVVMSEYGKIIKDGFLNAPLENVKGIVDAYGLSHRAVVTKLMKLSNGLLVKYLNERIDDWQSHTHVSPEYWDLFREFFPAVADLLTVNFEARSVTGTPVEQTFCLTATQIRANQSADTNAKNMNHASSIRGAISREMRDFEDSHDSNNKRRRKVEQGIKDYI